MLEAKSILHDEEKYLTDTLNKLIGRHNVLCDIENVFDNDAIAYDYFDRARKEVLDSGNQGYGSMFVLAIKNMVEDIREHEKEDRTDMHVLQSKLRDVESENRTLKAKLDNIHTLAVIGLNGGK